jgi:uncharacterized protein (UPF0147 family)
MLFDEGRILKQPHYKDPKTRNQLDPTAQPARQSPSRAMDSQYHALKNWETASMLDSANNKLQELMQLLYLLSRDPAVPNDARYHVTVAQGEIALLANVMRNTTEEVGDAISALENGTRAAHP